MAEDAPYFVNFSRSAGSLYATGWDLVIVGGEMLPGIGRVDNPSVMLRRDPNRKPGSNGGRPVYLGLEEQSVQIVCIVWTEEQRKKLREFCAKYGPVPGVPPKNYGLVSKWTEFSKIDRICIEGFVGPVPHSSPRVPVGLQVTFKASQWLGAAKDAKKNVTTQPRRTYTTTRPYVAPASPAATPGALGPRFELKE